MSDTEGMPAAHATTGGKSLAAVERPRYKSWRKKYRKMLAQFDKVMEDNKMHFREEQKLESTAKRLREELDGLREMLLDLNNSPALPPSLRYDVSIPEIHTAVGSIPSVVPDDISPQGANEMLREYTTAVQRGQIPHLDMHVIRDQIDKKLAKQGVITLDELESTVPHPLPRSVDEVKDTRLIAQLTGPPGPTPPGYLTSEEENANLLRLDAKLGDSASFEKLKEREKEGAADDKPWSELTAREIERQVELRNPMSAHNWLKRHNKQTSGGIDIDDNESLASHDTKPARGGKGKRDLAKQVGDRAVGRAREGYSPGAASTTFGDDDEMGFIDDHPSVSKKRGKADVDGTYRAKGGKSGSAAKGKRKRTGDDLPPPPSGSAKKVKLDAADEKDVAP